jgi:hypothetical protein
MHWWGWPILATMISGLAYWICRQPYVLLLLVPAGVLVYFQQVSERRALKCLAASRRGETICNFARSFGRQTDTWIIRAVYEELTRFLTIKGQTLPVRREDRCEKDLKIDPEDLDDLAQDIAQIMDVGMIFESSRPGVQYSQQTQGGTESFGILGQILQSLGTGRQKQIIA